MEYSLSVWKRTRCEHVRSAGGVGSAGVALAAHTAQALGSCFASYFSPLLEILRSCAGGEYIARCAFMSMTAPSTDSGISCSTSSVCVGIACANVVCTYYAYSESLGGGGVHSC